jgi:hypothetical protein
MTAMDELGRARAELRDALMKGKSGRLAEDRTDHLVDEHQAAVKQVLAHRLAEQLRAEADKPQQLTESRAASRIRSIQYRRAADLIDPEAKR